MTSVSYDDELFAFSRTNNKYYLWEDGDYHVKISSWDARIMKLYDDSNSRLCNMVLSQTLDIFLEKNDTPYELIVLNGSACIFEKSYLYTLEGREKPDLEKMIAEINWDLIDKKGYKAVAQVIFYQEADEEMIFYFAIAPFLLARAHKKEQDALMVCTIAALTSCNKRK